MSDLIWTRDNPARWDASKIGIVGEAPSGIFDSRYRECTKGDPVPGEWWRAEQDGEPVGYGWMDAVWGDAEMLLATAPQAQGKGVGTFILEQLEREARLRGYRYLYNSVRPTHPKADEVSGWLQKRGFKATEDGRLLRSVTGKK